MANMIEVTETGGAMLGKDKDEKILINSDNINKIEDANKDDVGTSTITFNDETSVNVSETKNDLKNIINP